ncbi:MAG: ABC transporter ATP-binding protein [Planctomycetota bacterium]
MSTVEISGVSHGFGAGGHKIAALVDVNLIVDSGECLVLLGPSGCGKTTLLRMISGLEQPDEGRVLIDDRDVRGISPHLLDIAMVFQDRALYPHLSVRDNIAFGLVHRGVGVAEVARRVDDMLDMLELGPHSGRRPASLSGGEQQRVALARALVRQPGLFLLDEPLGGLDADLRWRLRRRIRHVQRESGATAIFVTHDQEEAMALGDRICVVNQGRALQTAAPEAIYHEPANRWVAGFVGQPPMNFLRGSLGVEDGQPVFSSALGSLSVSSRYLARSPQSCNGDVILGVRCEDIVAATTDGACKNGNLLGAFRVHAVESLGDRRFAHLSHATCDVTLTVKQPGGHVLGVDDSIRLFVDEGDIHLFHAEGEQGRLDRLA